MAYVVDEGTLVVWNGSAWGDFFSAVTSIQNLALLGIGTSADATNPFSAKLNNTLFAAKTAAEGGDGDLRYKLSKEAAANTLSFLFQDDFSGRAEIGLLATTISASRSARTARPGTRASSSTERRARSRSPTPRSPAAAASC